MRLLLPTELNNVTGAALATPLDPLVFKLQQEVVPRVASLAIDPYGNTVKLSLLGISQSLKMPAQVMSVFKLPVLF